MEIIPVEINREYILDIIDITATGEGVGKIKGFTVFVDRTIPGDKVKIIITIVKKNYAAGKIIKLVKPSSHRVNPPCVSFGQCGGCQTQNIDYTYQLELKQKIVKDALERIGGLDINEMKMNPIIGMEEPFHYRNKAQYKIHKEGLGFYEKKSHNVVPLTDCKIQSRQSSITIQYLNQFIIENKIPIYNENTHKGILRGVVERVSYYNDEIMLILVIKDKEFRWSEKLILFIKENLPNVKSLYLNINTKKTNVVLSKENKLIYGKGKIIDSIGDLKYEISPLSFFQVNPIQTKVLYDKVVEFAELTGEETVFDLYCGIGTISLYLAKKAKKVYGVEVVPEAIEDAKTNKILNEIENTEFIVGKSEEEMPALVKKGVQADIVVVDPPRKGCDEKLLKSILYMSPKRVVYVSCNPATLGRDLKILSEGGYEVKEVQAVDMFPHSMHVECCVSLERIKE